MKRNSSRNAMLLVISIAFVVVIRYIMKAIAKLFNVLHDYMGSEPAIVRYYAEEPEQMPKIGIEPMPFLPLREEDFNHFQTIPKPFFRPGPAWSMQLARKVTSNINTKFIGILPMTYRPRKIQFRQRAVFYVCFLLLSL